MRSNKGQGYVAIDYVEFRYLEACAFTPPNAKPVPTTIPPTTVEPTEPPDCKFLDIRLQYIVYSVYIPPYN